MVSLPKLKFHFEPETGEALQFDAPVSVNSSGIFSVTIPEELAEVAKSVIAKEYLDRTVSCQLAQKYFKVSAPTLDLCREVIDRAGKEYVTCDVKVETVIVYSHDTKVSYWKDGDQIYPNGCGREKSGKWNGAMRGALEYTEHYGIGVAAVVMNKTTYTRSSSTKVEYSRWRDESIHHLAQQKTWAGRLNNFVRLSVKPKRMKEMPYTEEAAKFFYDMMIGVCRLADRIEEFFSSEENVLLAIERQTPLLGYGETAPDTKSDIGRNCAANASRPLR